MTAAAGAMPVPEVTRPCPVCGSGDESRVFAEARYDLAKLDRHAFASRKVPEYMHYRLVLCPTCDLVYASPVPSAEGLARAYDEAAFDHAFTFIYSPRNGTEAAGFDDQVPDDVKHERLERLVELVQSHAARRNAALVGTVQEVLSEGPSRTDPLVCRGKTRGGKTTLFTPAVPAGTAASVLIEETTSQTLRGRVASAVPA
jgi:hypothetical protein